MLSENLVARKMEVVQKTFLEVQDTYSPNTLISELLDYLNSFEAEFRSIAYESASMSIALSDFKNQGKLDQWLQFLQGGTTHATQIHVGLGWALAQQQINPVTNLSELQPMMRYRVLDGYGYYEGIFRKRKSILNQQKPEFSDDVVLGAYDQGLGRSLWYLNMGNVEEARRMLEKFAPERHANLWRGVGIAVTYVGGLNIESLQQLKQLAGIYKKQMVAGSIMALISRHLAGFVTPYTEMTCQTWIGKDTEELLTLYKPSLVSGEDMAYPTWIKNIERDF